MKSTFLKHTLLGALAVCSLGLTSTARAATSADGDLFLGFRASSGTGSTKAYMVNLGQASQFTGATGPITVTTSAVGADLVTNFGSSWKTRSDVFWGVAGTTGSFNTVGTDPEKTIYATRAQSILGTQSTPWKRASESTQAGWTNKMVAMMTAFNGSTSGTASNSVVQQNPDTTNNWASYQPGGTLANSGPAPGISFAAFNPTIEGDFTNGTSGSILDLYRMAYTPTSGQNGDYLGRFILNDSGVLTFIPVAAFGTNTVQLASATGSVVEDAASGKVSVTITRTGDVSSACSVQLSTVNGTATSPTDYTAISSQVVSFAIGESSKTVDITIVNRAGFQGDRNFTVSLASPTSATLGATTSATITIQEAIEPSVLQFSTTTFSANQESTSVNVTITRTGGGSAVTVNLSTADDTALAGTDYTAITNQTVNIPANVNSVNVPITLSAPTGNQANKQFLVSISSPGSNASLNTDTSTTNSIVRIIAQDSVAPTVAISTPAANASLPGTLGGSVTITGTATDAKGVDKVQVSINGGAFADASLGGSANAATWSISVQPGGGLTTITAKSLDARGNASSLATRSFTYKIMSNLTVTVAGPSGASSGTIAGKLTGTAPYEVGKSYTLTATAATGLAFDNWAGAGLTAPATEVNKLTFVFTSTLAANPVITATFVTNPFAATANVAGNYSGLIAAHTGTVASNATNGCISVDVTVGTGAFTGTVKIDGSAFGPTILKGVFDNNGVAKFGANRATTISIARTNKAPYSLSMTLNTTTKQITGTLKETSRSGFSASSDFTADRAGYAATAPITNTDLLNVGGTSGFYTAVLPARNLATVSLDPTVTFLANELPKGSGFTSAKLTKTGDVSYVGTLADGTAFTASAKLSAANKALLFAQLYASKGGSIGGQISLTVNSGDAFINGTDFWWFRPYQAVQHYPYGWPEGILTDLHGSEYNVVAGTSVVPGLPAVGLTGNATLSFIGGLLSSSVTKDANISTANAVTKLGTPADASYTLTITPATGLLGGTFTHSDGTKPKFSGMIVQKGANAGGRGHFLSTAPKTINGLGEAGAFTLQHK